MQCCRILTNVDFGISKKSCFVLEADSDWFLNQVVDVIGEYRTSSHTMRDLVDWVRGDKGPFVLLVSLDQKEAMLRSTSKEGDLKTEPGEELKTFFHWPIQGGVVKCAAVLDRDFGLLPEKCKEFGYTPVHPWPKIPRRTDLRTFAEFDPVFHAQIRDTVQATPTMTLMWHYLLGEDADKDFGKTFRDVEDELSRRLNTWRDYAEVNSPLGECFNAQGLTLREVKNRKKRVLAYAEFVDQLCNQVDNNQDLTSLKTKLDEAINDLDLALELYVVLFWKDNSGWFEGELKNILWERICELTLVPPPPPKPQIIY